MLSALLVLAVLALGGCSGPDPADLRAGGPLVERWRIPSPVAGWDFADPARGLLGTGQRLVSLAAGPGRVRWIHDLPPGFRVTASSVTVAGGAVLVRGEDRFRVLAIDRGTVLWEREFEGRVVAEEEGDAVITAGCDGPGCELTGWHPLSGTRQWSRRFGERVDMVTSGPLVCYCLFLLGRRTVWAIGTEDGRTIWSMRKPAGVTRLIPALDRLILWTPPAEPRCAATLRGVEGGRIAWTREITTRCGVKAPSPGGDAGGNLEIPVPGGLEVLWGYDAGSRTVPLDPGEVLIDDGHERITWTPGAGYRSIDRPGRTPAAVPPPSGGRPWARAAPVGMWLLRSGPGLALYDPHRRAVRWTGPSPALITDYDRLIHLDGSDLVGIGPREGAVKR